jgi:glycerophosphoryl diester phosphodiesterase
MPENTIPSMKKAIDDGANIIEVDIQISKDNMVTVAHDAYINRTYSLLPNGEEIPESDSRKYLLYQMEYDSIRKFDVGSKFHKDFPQQKKMFVHIPLLSELIDSVEAYTVAKEFPPIIYNIEIKSDPEKDGVYQPAPAKLIKLVMDVVNAKRIGGRFYLQSFDIRQIQEVHKKYPHVVVGFLTGKKDVSLDENLRQIGFKPQIYSPQYKLITAQLIQACRDQGMKCVPWTVNTSDEMNKLITLGVDGIITDYPHLLSDIK